MKYLNLDGLSNFLTNLRSIFADKTHVHEISDVKNLQTSLNSLQSSIDSVDGAVDNITSGTVVVKEAEHATSADSATTATTATNANHASTADSATSATTADKVSKTMTVQLNGGTTEGTNKFTYNGSTAKSINITPSSIGAQAAGNYAASSHTHDDRYYTEDEIDAKIDAIVGEGASTTLDTIGEISAAIEDNQDMLTTLNNAIGGKQATITGGASTITSSNLTASRVLVSDGNGKVAVSAVTSTELGYLDGVTSAIQTQLNNKAASGHTHTLASLGAAASSHTHAIADVADLQTTLDSLSDSIDDKAPSSHSHTITANASDDDIVVLEGTNGTNAVTYKATHATSGVTAGSYGDSANQTPAYGGTFKVPYVTVNETGHVTGISAYTVKIPAAVTLSSLGVTATAAELNKLDGVTATAAELNYMDGVTSNVQTQINTLSDVVAAKAAVQFVTWEDGD